MTDSSDTTAALHQPPSPLEDPSSPLSRIARQPMMLGLFLPTQTGAFSQSTYPRDTRWDFEYNRELTLKAEAHGLDFAFGLQQWVKKGGFGGETNYRENFLDPFISTIALAPLTTRLVTISTVHVLYGSLHPLYLARFAATADHIAQGRFGLNIVTGYDAREPLMFGMQRIEHDERYARADEFASIMEDLWAGEEDLTFHGRWYDLESAYVSPRPVHGRPIMVSASASAAGFAYAADHSDIVFTSSRSGAPYADAMRSIPTITKEIDEAYDRTGRQHKTIIFPMVICKETREEAYAYRDAITARADTASIVNYDARHRAGDAQGWPEHVPSDRVLGGHVQIIGSPTDVADQLEGLHEAGIDGAQLGFYDYGPELDFFAEAVLPILEARGLRIPDPIVSNPREAVAAMTAVSSTEPVLVRAEHDGPITTVTLSNPERANALTYGAMQQFIEGLRAAHSNRSLLLIIRAEGDDFTVGRDQKEKVPGVTKAQSLGLILEANALLRGFPGISVSVIRGRALGFGSGISVQSDLSIAADTATLGFDEVRHGLAPLVVAEYLPPLIGPRATADLIYTGRDVSASEALAIGLVSRVVPEADLEAEARGLCDSLVAGEPGALRLMKSYSARLRAGGIADPQAAAVAELDTWLSAGRPAFPDVPENPAAR